MSRWSFRNDRHDQLRRFLSRVTHGHREKSAQELMVFSALKPKGGTCGPILLGAVTLSWILYSFFSIQGLSMWVICAGAWCILRRDRSRQFARCRAVVGWLVLLVGISSTAMYLRSPHIHTALDVAMAEHTTVIAEVVGTVLEDPKRHPPLTSGLDRFRHFGDSLHSHIRVYSLRINECVFEDVDFVLPMRCDRGAGGISGGDEIFVRARLESSTRPINPGQEWDAYQDPVFKLVITDPRLIRRVDEKHPWRAVWIRMRSSIRNTFRTAVDRISGDDQRKRAFLQMLLLGNSVEGHDELRKTFAGAGLSHVLAISGLHLAAIAIAICFVCTCLTSNPRIGALVTMAILLLYTVILEPRASIHRSVLMIVIVLTGHVFSRYWRSDQVFILVICVVVSAVPDAVGEPGFQLTFAVTAGLIFLCGPCRVQWFGLPDHIGRSRKSIAISRSGDALATSTIAWLVGFPLVLYHFGRVAPMGILAALLESIPVFLALVLGFPSMLLVAVFGTASFSGEWILSASITVIFMIADTCRSCVPEWHAPPPSGAWVIAVGSALVLAVKSPNIRWRRIAWPVVLFLSVLPFGLRLTPNPRVPFSICSLAVGDGSAILIRSERTAILYDAGSTTFLSVGSRIITPALQALGVRTLDAMIISHLNLDHVSGIEDVVDSCNVSAVVVSDHIKKHAASNPGKLAASVWDVFISHGVNVHEVSQGDTLDIGELSLSMYHPARGELNQSRNDESLVIGITSRHEAGKIIVCGDAEGEALRRVRTRYPKIECDVLELPHHGSWHPGAVQFVDQVKPRTIIQSTGTRRFRRDRWKDVLDGRDRYVTCRDGAVSILLKDVLSLKRTEDPRDT